MLIPIEDVGSIGLVKDINPVNLPLGAWTEATNVRFVGGCVKKSPEFSWIVDPTSFDPHAVFNIGEYLMVYCGLANVVVVPYGRTGAATDITRVVAYSGNSNVKWNAQPFNGYVILNNGVDVPQIWQVPPVGDDDFSTKLVDLPNWPAGDRCRVMRAFKNYLIALGITRGGTFYSRLIKWSHEAAPGTYPDSWDETNPAKDAGEVVLAEGVDALVDCLDLGSSNIIYTSNSTWRSDLIGAPYIFSFDRIFHSSGLLGQGCVASVRGSHFVVSQDDIIVHNGTSIEAACEKILREEFFKTMVFTEGVSRPSVVVNERKKEVWVIYPISYPNNVCSMALVWNWAFNTWTMREMPAVATASYAKGSAVYRMVACAPLPRRVYGLDYDVFQSIDPTVLSTVVRDGLCPSLNRDGRPFQDPYHMHEVSQVWPLIHAPNGERFDVTVGSHNTLDDPIVWGASKPFIAGCDQKVDLDPIITGRYIAVKFTHGGWQDFDFSGYALEIATLGEL